jgi:hypothetical protein
MLAGPSDLVDKLSSMVNAKDDCSNFDSLPNLGFQMGDTVLNLKPDDYMDRSSNGCSFSLMALDVPPPKGPVFIFGDPFLRRFVTIYDRSKPAVGFAVAKHGGDESRDLIGHVAGGKVGSADASSSPPETGNANEVTMHLDAGLMGGDSSGDSGDSGSSSAASSTESPAQAGDAVDSGVVSTPVPAQDPSNRLNDADFARLFGRTDESSATDTAAPESAASERIAPESTTGAPAAFATTEGPREYSNMFNFGAGDAEKAARAESSAPIMKAQAPTGGDDMSNLFGNVDQSAPKETTTGMADMIATTAAPNDYANMFNYYRTADAEMATTRAPRPSGPEATPAANMFNYDCAADAEMVTTRAPRPSGPEATPAHVKVESPTERMRRMFMTEGVFLQKPQKQGRLISVKLHRTN